MIVWLPSFFYDAFTDRQDLNQPVLLFCLFFFFYCFYSEMTLPHETKL